MGSFFETERLYLDPIDEGVLQGDYPKWFNDMEVCRFNSHFRMPYSYNQCVEYIKSVECSNRLMVMTARTKDDNTHIGNISLQNINYIDRCAELAFFIGAGSEYWGKGYATEAAKPLIEHAQKALNLHRLYLGTMDDNIGMQRVAKKLGFIQEGIRKEALYKNGKYHDIVEYGLILE